MPGFEPGTSCAQGKRASRAALHPDYVNNRIQDTKSDTVMQTYYSSYYIDPKHFDPCRGPI